MFTKRNPELRLFRSVTITRTFGVVVFNLEYTGLLFKDDNLKVVAENAYYIISSKHLWA